MKTTIGVTATYDYIEICIFNNLDIKKSKLKKFNNSLLGFNKAIKCLCNLTQLKISKIMIATEKNNAFLDDFIHYLKLIKVKFIRVNTIRAYHELNSRFGKTAMMNKSLIIANYTWLNRQVNWETKVDPLIKYISLKEKLKLLSTEINKRQNNLVKSVTQNKPETYLKSIVENLKALNYETLLTKKHLSDFISNEPILSLTCQNTNNIRNF